MSTEPCSVELFRKSNNLMDPLKFESKGKICESVHFDPSFWQHVHHTRVVDFWYVIFLCAWFEVCFLLGEKQEAKFGGVMSV